MNREKALGDCAAEFSFWACNGSVIRNIYELCSTLNGMDEWVFCYHVNSDRKKNDFANWIREVLGDEDLADSLSKVMDRKKYIRIIERRIRTLEDMPLEQLC